LDHGEAAQSESAQVKLATEMAVRVTNQAMQLHGGNGYTTERRIERYWRDARLTTIFEVKSNAASSAIACSRGHDGRRISRIPRFAARMAQKCQQRTWTWIDDLREQFRPRDAARHSN
jgi:hypothetical protein